MCHTGSGNLITSSHYFALYSPTEPYLSNVCPDPGLLKAPLSLFLEKHMDTNQHSLLETSLYFLGP